MAALHKHGEEVCRWLSARGHLLSARADGTTLAQSFNNRKWHLHSRKRKDVSIEDWRTIKLLNLAEMPRWRREVTALPTTTQLNAWCSNVTCETPAGTTVEHDGTDANGVPSWLLILGFI